MRTPWMRTGMALTIGLLLLIMLAFGTAWAAGGGSVSLAAVLGGQVGQGKSGTTLSADKTAEGFWTHVVTFSWSLEKMVTPDALTLARGESGEVTYTISATRQQVGEADIAGVRGTICVTNGGDVATEGLAITDVVEVQTGGDPFRPFITTTVDVSAYPTLAPGESHCYPYEVFFAPVLGAQAYRNHAIVTILNHSGHLGEPFGPEPKADFQLPKHPTLKEVNASATVTDEEHCPDGFACVPSETGPWTFSDSGSVSFHKSITNVSACDVTAELTNVATLTESDTHETRTASAVVHLTAPSCPVGCVLSQGFWKTHPDAWPEGHHPKDPFFRSGKTWMEVLWTAPKGDAYYILAHQYIAAVLNEAHGATPPAEVAAVIAEAEAWFTNHGPGVASSSETGQMLIHWSEILAAFNEGKMGVPHCEEVEAGPAQPLKKGGQQPETPPGLKKRPATPPGLDHYPENPPGNPPGQENRPSTPPGQDKGKGK